MSEEMIRNASDEAVAHIERVDPCANRREIEIARAAGIVAAKAVVSAYNPNERLREAAKELLSRVDSFAREIAEPAFFSERETLRAALEEVK